jgi:antitoxin VapB
MGTARVFRSGNSQAVRLPKQFRLKSKEVEIFRRGDEIVLREKDGTMVRAFDLLAGLPDDLTLVGREEDQPRNARDCNGASLSVGHRHLHLHPAEETGGGFAPIPEAPSRRSSSFGNYLRRTAVQGSQERATSGSA